MWIYIVFNIAAAILCCALAAFSSLKPWFDVSLFHPAADWLARMVRSLFSADSFIQY
jgi:hypothetical protein